MCYRAPALLLLLLLMPLTAWAELIVSHRSQLEPGAERYMYDIEVIRLALDKTRSSHGSFVLQAIPPTPYSRRVRSLEQETYPNLLMELAYTKELGQNQALTYIAFPLDFGVTGYRICFVNPAIKETLKEVATLQDLQRYSIGQGAGWVDTAILRHNGFRVVEIPKYQSMFKMIAGGRFDLLCRGITELMKEYEEYKGIGNLAYDESFMLVYPLPRFFYLNKNNPELKARIELGLKIAFEDGSLQQLWRRENQHIIARARIESRKIFHLENPLLKELDNSYQQYIIDPVTLGLTD